MATEVWGMLAKSQIDPETIEEAIARLILAHNEDETAHLGVGQSLQSHKASEIIDHLVRSIVADKLSATQRFMRSSIEALDGWDYWGSGTIALRWPGVVLFVGWAVDKNYHLLSSTTSAQLLIDNEKNPIFQSTVKVQSAINSEFWLAFGSEPPAYTEAPGFGFWFHDDKLYGYYNELAGTLEVELSGVNVATLNIFRAEVNSGEKKIYFYVNGVQKGVISFTSFGDSDNASVYFYIKNLSAAQNQWLYVGEFFIAIDY